MPKLPGPPSPPDPTIPLKALRKMLEDARKGIEDSIEEVKELGKELRGKRKD